MAEGGIFIVLFATGLVQASFIPVQQVTFIDFIILIPSIITTRSTVKIVPAATYLNPDTQKLAILNENKNKGGVYR